MDLGLRLYTQKTFLHFCTMKQTGQPETTYTQNEVDFSFFHNLEFKVI